MKEDTLRVEIAEISAESLSNDEIRAEYKRLEAEGWRNVKIQLTGRDGDWLVYTVTGER